MGAAARADCDFGTLGSPSLFGAQGVEPGVLLGEVTCGCVFGGDGWSLQHQIAGAQCQAQQQKPTSSWGPVKESRNALARRPHQLLVADSTPRRFHTKPEEAPSIQAVQAHEAIRFQVRTPSRSSRGQRPSLLRISVQNHQNRRAFQ